ncbi:MAG: preprotein translocase subunit SecG [Mycoplasmataceae bacterium]|nr:preprotein translocase subunit SecG [Mycoplasmataceae bacterium]
MELVYILTIILLILGLILIVLIILQSGRIKNLGSSIIGTKNVELFEHKKRGWEKILHLITIGLVISFVMIAFLILFLV